MDNFDSIRFCQRFWYGRSKKNNIAVDANDLTYHKPIQRARAHQNKKSQRPYFHVADIPSARVDLVGENIARCLQAPVLSPSEASSSARTLGQTCHAK